MIDLHIHTNYSDGVLSPKEVIEEALKNNIHTISITDHDTIDAYTNEELFNYANKVGIKIIPGVEISTKYKGIGIHILGYNFDINNKKLKEKLNILRNARHEYLYDVSIKLKELGYSINTEKLNKIEAVTKAHIAQDIIKNESNKNLLIEEFRHIPSKGEFIETIMNENCPAYVKKETITPNEVVKLIKKSGGKVILAHPIAYQYEDDLTDNDILNLIKESKVDGIETNYIYIDRFNHKINNIDKWNKIALDNNLITTIGSDFHGYDNIHPKIGLIDEKINLSNEKINEIIEKLSN